jgi:hypothetical protein
MARRRKRSKVSLGAEHDVHFDRFEKWIGIGAASVRNAQRAAADGRCRSAVTALVHAAEAVGAMNAEELALTQPGIRVTRSVHLTPAMRRKAAGLNVAIDKTRSKIAAACKL